MTTLADVLTEAADAAGESWCRTARVTALALPRLTVNLDGGTLTLPKLASYTGAAVNDVVIVLCPPGRKVIIGKIG